MKYTNILILSILLLQSCKKTDHTDTIPLKETSTHIDTFTVAFYNVQNLFDLHYSGTEYPEYKPGVSNWDRGMMHKKIESIASVIAQLNAEVVGLCEVENLNALKLLQRTLENNGYAYKYSAIADGPEKSNTCPALISKYPLLNCSGIPVKLHNGITRNILSADIKKGGNVLKIFVNHWPSKINPESWRVSAAKVLDSLVKEIPSGTDYLLIGDFNSDYDDHWKITTSGGDDTQGITALHYLLGTVNKQAKFNTEIDMKETRKGIHYDLWLELPESKRMSHFYQGNRQTPDHILLPPSLYDSIGISYLDNSFDVFSWDGKLLSGNRPYRWQIFQKKGVKLHTGKGYSDHLPVLAKFVSGPFKFNSEPSTALVNTQIVQKPSDTLCGGCKSHRNGWLLCNAAADHFIDTLRLINGQYSLCIRGEAQKNNGCLARLVVKGGKIGPDGYTFNIAGSGKFCVRSRIAGIKWEYLDIGNLYKTSSARYTKINQSEWKRIVLKKDQAQTGDLEIEIRVGKGEPFCLLIG